jgi:NAD(P)-dependent dehydrogenase (short-subunit alcohol dehydrogenase family)
MPVVLITGANRGLCLEFARQYLTDGWQVLASCRDPDSASELQRLAKASSGKLTVGQPHQLLARSTAHHGI